MTIYMRCIKQPNSAVSWHKWNGSSWDDLKRKPAGLAGAPVLIDVDTIRHVHITVYAKKS
jgi:hypothetical protein